MAIISHKVEGVSNDVTHYARVYPVNKKGHAQSELDGQIASALTNAFPAEPSSYNLIGTYSSSQTFTAPEDGWYQIELFGRSGAGGKGAYFYNGKNMSSIAAAGGGGGGGGAYCCSNKIKLKKGDTIDIVISATCTVTITASTGESYSVMTCTSGANGGAGSASVASATRGSGGNGGSATGGNHANISGGKGGNGVADTTRGDMGNGAVGVSGSGGSGGTSGYTGGNTGGAGGKGEVYGSSTENLTKTARSGGSAKAGFCKIYRGDTNKAA